MKSAEDFSLCFLDGESLLDFAMADRLVALIRARDKEIVEACKDAVANSQPLTAGELEARCERRLAIKALDSVLGTLG